MKYLSLLFALFLLAACGGEEGISEADTAAIAAQESAYESMMEIHDRVMPMVGNITQYQRTISEQMLAEDLNPERKELLVAINEQLEDANDGMMDWMSNVTTLNELREDEDAEDILPYIKEQTASIAAVESDIKAALAAAGQVLGGETHSHDHGDGHDHSHDH